MHTQKKDRAVLSPEVAERCRRVREAAERSFSPNNDSAWVMLGVLCPFLVPLIRLVAWRFPDKLLVSFTTCVQPDSQPIFRVLVLLRRPFGDWL